MGRRGRKPGQTATQSNKKNPASQQQQQRKQKEATQAPEVDPSNPAPVTILRPSGKTMTWDYYLQELENLTKIPPVIMFPNAPLSLVWEDVAEPGLVVELRYPFAKCKADIYWVGTIVYYAGYFALVQFERFDLEPAQLAWITFCSNVPRPLGWSEKNGKFLYPGKETAEAHPNYMEKLQDFVSGKQTISDDFVKFLADEVHTMVLVDFDPAIPVEAEDAEDLSRNRLGRITAVCGDRFHVQYLDAAPQDDNNGGVWFSKKLEKVFPLGWSAMTGVELVGVVPGIKFPSPPPTDLIPTYPEEVKIAEGMCLEARHPVFPHKIVTATIAKVLNLGYFIVETCDSCVSHRTKFYCHVTSPYIFPVGWGTKWGIKVENHMAGRMWEREYLSLERLPQRPPHHFREGMVLEAFDTTQAAFCGPATIIKVADHMLYIHFNNWNHDVDGNSLWTDAEFGEIYPIGYAELIGLEFQGHV